MRDHMLAHPVNEEQHKCGVSCGAEMLTTFGPNLIIESTDDPKRRRELAIDFKAAWLVSFTVVLHFATMI